VQDVKQTLDGDAKAYFDANKGKIVDAIVERVRDGSTVQVILLPSLQTITLQLSGIKAPTYRKDIPNQPDQIEPFGGEAKYFTESRLLQQDVKVILEGFSNNNFVGTVIHPNGNISEALVKEGFAKVVDWSITLVTGGPKNLVCTVFFFFFLFFFQHQLTLVTAARGRKVRQATPGAHLEGLQAKGGRRCGQR